MVTTPTWHTAIGLSGGDRGSIHGPSMLYFRCKNLALNIRDCVSLVGRGSSVGGVHTWHVGNGWGQILSSLPFEWFSCYTVSEDCYQVYGTYARGSTKLSHINHFCFNPRMGCLEYLPVTKAVSTQHVCIRFAIDRERFAAGCPLVPVSRDHLEIWNERARNVRDRSRAVDFVVWTLDPLAKSAAVITRLIDILLPRYVNCHTGILVFVTHNYQSQ